MRRKKERSKQGHVYTCTGVLCCFALFVCLTLLAAAFFLPSRLSLKHVHVYTQFGVSFFLGKVTALGVLLCFVCLTLLVSFFLPSH